LLENLNGRGEGIDREKLKALVKHEGSTAFGVICNQLAKGGWLRQEKNGKKYTLYPESTAPASDELFVSQEIPAPDLDERPIEEQLAESADMADTNEIPEGWELWEGDPIIRKPMTPELQAILDDARQAGYLVLDDHANEGSILIRPYYEYELDENFILYSVPKPCGTPRISKTGDRQLEKGLDIGPDLVAHRLDVKPAYAEGITDYEVMRSALELPPRIANEPEQQKR
jgi:hypothetical protein